jgi:hypothetical protein
MAEQVMSKAVALESGGTNADAKAAEGENPLDRPNVILMVNIYILSAALAGIKTGP